jgi:hypothetical protein
MTTVAAKVDPQTSKKVSFKLRGESNGGGDWCQIGVKKHVIGISMADFRITLDLDAYERLRGAKLGNESFSDAVRRLVPSPPVTEGPFDLSAWLERLAKISFSDAFLDAVEQQVAERSPPT